LATEKWWGLSGGEPKGGLSNQSSKINKPNLETIPLLFRVFHSTDKNRLTENYSLPFPNGRF
jgi:hypothetical protein